MPRHIPQKTSLELAPHQVLLRPLVTEKGTNQSTRYNAYAFEINKASLAALVSGLATPPTGRRPLSPWTKNTPSSFSKPLVVSL
jgi:hypothetical protein